MAPQSCATVNDIPLLPDRGVYHRINVPKAERTWQKHTGSFNELLIIGFVPMCLYQIDMHCHTNAAKTLSVYIASAACAINVQKWKFPHFVAGINHKNRFDYFKIAKVKTGLSFLAHEKLTFRREVVLISEPAKSGFVRYFILVYVVILSVHITNWWVYSVSPHHVKFKVFA